MATHKCLMLCLSLCVGLCIWSKLVSSAVADELDLIDDLSISELDESEEEFLRLLEEKNLVSPLRHCLSP